MSVRLVVEVPFLCNYIYKDTITTTMNSILFYVTQKYVTYEYKNISVKRCVHVTFYFVLHVMLLIIYVTCFSGKVLYSKTYAALTDMYGYYLLLGSLRY